MKSLKRILTKYRELKKIKNYNLGNDLKTNEKILKNLGFKIDKIKKNLNNFELDYFDKQLSFHYHFFAGVKGKIRKNKKLNILEIGTLDGNFTNFLSNLLPTSSITTIDLADNDQNFKNTYHRDSPLNLAHFLKKRKNNLKPSNIKFLKMHSINLLKTFKKINFDYIFIDGDHQNPQVTIDIIFAIMKVKKNGMILLDDVIKNRNFKKKEYVSTDSFITLNHLEKLNIVSIKNLIKRIKEKNAIEKKFISIIKVLKQFS